MEYSPTIKKFNLRSFFAGMLPIFVLAHFAHHLMTALTVPLLPMIRDEFALDYTRTGFATAAFHLPYGISQLPSGCCFISCWADKKRQGEPVRG